MLGSAGCLVILGRRNLYPSVRQTLRNQQSRFNSTNGLKLSNTSHAPANLIATIAEIHVMRECGQPNVPCQFNGRV